MGRPGGSWSVGYATDVFNAPYSGLQQGDLDQAQFDVIRDVAAVSDASMLIRRDLYRGLGGVDPAMPPTSAAIDFCQRARLRGGRVVGVPSGVVRRGCGSCGTRPPNGCGPAFPRGCYPVSPTPSRPASSESGTRRSSSGFS